LVRRGLERFVLQECLLRAGRRDKDYLVVLVIYL